MSKSDNTDFDKELKELENIVEWFESPEVDLNEALPKFERGMELATKLRKHLANVENRVEVIKKKFDKKPAAGKDLNQEGIIDQGELLE